MKRGFKIWDFNILFLLLVLFIFISINCGVVKASEDVLLELNIMGTTYGHELLWKADVTGSYDEQSIAIYANGIVYVNSIEDSKIYAVNATTGSHIWNFTTNSAQGFGGPVYYDGIIYDAFGKVWALNATNGTEIWNYSMSGVSFSQGVALDDNYVVAVSYLQDIVLVLNRTNGEHIWNVSVGGGSTAEPLLYNDYVIVALGPSSGTKNIIAYNVTNGSEIWSADTGDYWDSSPILYNNIIYVGEYSSNYLRARYLENGSEVWSTDIGAGTYTTPSAHNDVIFISRKGSYSVYLRAFNATDGSAIWQFSDSGAMGLDSVFNQPAISNGLVFFNTQGDPDDGYIYAVNETDGSLIWKYHIQEDIFGYTSIAQGNIYVVTDDDYLYAFDFGIGGGNYTLIGHDSNRTGYCSDCLTQWQYVKANCTANVNITCNITNYYDHSVFDITLDAESSNLRYDWYNSSGDMIESNSTNYTISGLASSENKIFTLVPTGEVTVCANIVSSGAYYLISDISNVESTCFQITSSNVELDCQGHTIDGQASGRGIFVDGASGAELTNVTIRNCSVNDFYDGIYFDYVDDSFIYNSLATSAADDGFHIHDSDNNIFSNVTADSNVDDGFCIDGSDDNRFYNITSTGHSGSNDNGLYLYNYANYNNFTEGIINDNYYGIYFGYAKYNRFSELNITDNSNYGVNFPYSSVYKNYIYDNYFNNTNNIYSVSGADNYWNITKTAETNIMGGDWVGGNYWANTSGTGFSETCTDADGDGICDDSYDMGDGEVDYLPLFVDTIPPIVTLNLPADYTNQSSTTVNFNCSFTDNNYLKNITLYGNWSGGWHANETKNITGTSNETIFAKTLIDGSYIWNCLASDSGGNTAFNDSNWTINVDTTAPTITFSCSPISVRAGGTIICSCSATDDIDSSPSVSYTVNPSTLSTGTYTTTCTATDDAGNSASSSISYTVNPLGGGGYPTYKPTQEQLQSKEGYEKTLRKKWKIQFESDNETHTIKLDKIINKTVIITISSEPVTFNLTVNETKKLNLGDDNYYDLQIFLEDVNYYEADLVVKLIHEEILAEEKRLEEKIEEKIKWWSWPIILVSIVLIVIIIIIITRYKKMHYLGSNYKTTKIKK